MERQKFGRSVTDLPDELESSQAKLVYLYVETVGETTVGDVNKTLGMKKLSALAVLQSLSRKGLVERDGDDVRAS